MKNIYGYEESKKHIYSYEESKKHIYSYESFLKQTQEQLKNRKLKKYKFLYNLFEATGVFGMLSFWIVFVLAILYISNGWIAFMIIVTYFAGICLSAVFSNVFEDKWSMLKSGEKGYKIDNDG